MSQAIHYRPEIDGLRMIAVLAVLIFHLDPNLLPGGFLGVDVFFVISGFLITSIIHKQLLANTFRLKNFWLRRFKRLYPAMMIMVSLTLLAGSYILVKPERDEIILQAIAAVFSFENILMWQTTGGYWDIASEDIAFLHAWSLSLEEQFYIVFPILLIIAHRFLNKHTLMLLAILGIASFIGSIYGTLHHRNFTFYMLPTRMWELIIGGILAIQTVRHGDEPAQAKHFPSASSIGLIIILCSYVFINNNEKFPGYLAAYPCLGTAMIIWSGQKPGIVKTFLSHNISTYIGKMSYSLYLYHWPVIVLMNYISSNPSTTLILLITFFLSALSYHFVEKPFRYGFKRSKMAFLLLPTGLAASFIPFVLMPTSPIVATKATSSDLANWESDRALARGYEYEATEFLRKGESGVIFGDTNQPIAICVVGSSHARVLCRPIDQFANERGMGGVSMSISGVGLTSKPGPRTKDADLLNETRINKLKALQPKLVVIAGMWNIETRDDGDLEKLSAQLKALSGYAENVIIIGQVPLIMIPKEYGTSLRKYILTQISSGAQPEFLPTTSISNTNNAIGSIVDDLNIGNLHYLDPGKMLINKNGSVTVVRDDLFLYADNNHLNDDGAGYLFRNLIEPYIIGLY